MTLTQQHKKSFRHNSSEEGVSHCLSGMESVTFQTVYAPVHMFVQKARIFLNDIYFVSNTFTTKWPKKLCIFIQGK